MCKMFFGFIFVAVAGVTAYIKLRFLWNHWVFWLVGSLVIINRFRLSMLLVVQELSMILFMMFLSLAATQKQAKLSFSLMEIDNNTVWKDGSFQFPLPSLVFSLFLSLQQVKRCLKRSHYLSDQELLSLFTSQFHKQRQYTKTKDGTGPTFSHHQDI